MSYQRHVLLFGACTVEFDGRPEPVAEADKTIALLGYLARQERAIPRREIATLLWGETTDYRSRRNLTRALGQLTTLLPGCLRADQRQVQWAPGEHTRVDARTCAELLEPSLAGSTAREASRPERLEAAIDLYRGEFLAGLDLGDCAEFETWLVREREHWCQRIARALSELIAYHSHYGQPEQAERAARRWLDLEPWQEEAHQALMLLLAYRGRRGEAIAQFETCCRVLAVEFGIEPYAETVDLAARIRAGAFPRPREVAGEAHTVGFGARPPLRTAAHGTPTSPPSTAPTSEPAKESEPPEHRWDSPRDACLPGTDPPNSAFADTFNHVLTVAFSHDGRYLAAGTNEGLVHLWHTKSWQPCHVLDSRNGFVYALAFGPRDDILAANGPNHSIGLWNLHNGQICGRLVGHVNNVYALAWSIDGTTLASASHDKTVRLWNRASGRQLTVLHGHQGPVWRVVYSPDGATIASVGCDGTVRIWNSRTWKLLQTIDGRAEKISAIAYSSDGATLASAGRSRSIVLWDTITWQPHTTFQGHAEPIHALAFSPDGTTLASISDDHSIHLWDLTDPRTRRTEGRQ